MLGFLNFGFLEFLVALIVTPMLLVLVGMVYVFFMMGKKKEEIIIVLDKENLLYPPKEDLIHQVNPIVRKKDLSTK